MSVYLALELQSLNLYVLASFNRESSFSTEAGLKYFILGAFSSGVFLFGSSLVYGVAGSTSFEDIRLLFCLTTEKFKVIQVGILFIASSLLFKVAAFPFHFWSPDVYDGSPLSSTVFFAVVPKIALILIFLRFFFYCFGAELDYWEYLLGFCSFFSIFLGSFAALKQRKLKRLFAYSAVGHVGYILIAVASTNLAGVHASLVYVVLYTIMSLGIWSILSMGCFQQLSRTWTLSDVMTIGKINTSLACCLLTLFFSMAGIPPLSGFYAKFCVFLATIGATFYTYSVLLIIITVVSTFFYLRVVKIAYFEKPIAFVLYKPFLLESALVLNMSCGLILFCFINPNFLWLITYSMALCLMG